MPSHRYSAPATFALKQQAVYGSVIHFTVYGFFQLGRGKMPRVGRDKKFVPVMLLSLLLSGCVGATDPAEKRNSAPTLEGPLTVSKVTDGDTIRVIRDGVEIRVRIIGIDTPEIVKSGSPIECYGPESSDYANSKFNGTSVYLEYDPSQGELDQFGRVLAHVWTADKTLYAKAAIASGFGREKTYQRASVHQEEFLAAQNRAKTAKVGLWGVCAVDPS